MTNRLHGVARFQVKHLRNWVLGIALGLSLVAMSPIRAQAGNAETADVAVELFIRGAQYTGLPITADEGLILKQVVTCGLNATPLPDCAKNVILKTALEKIGGPPEVGVAVKCLVDGGSPDGCVKDVLVSKLPPEVQPMVSCTISGGNPADCSRKFVEGFLVDKLPEEVRPAATCMISTQDPKKCGTELVVKMVAENVSPEMKAQADTIAKCVSSAQNAASCIGANVPDQLKPLATFVGCIAQNPNVGQCTAQTADTLLPPGTPDVARSMISCIGDPRNFADCAKDKGIAAGKDYVTSNVNPAIKDQIEKAIETINRLKPDAPLVIDAGVNSGNLATLANILMVANGIKEENWGKVVLGAGPELAIIAGNIILSIFLTPALAGVLSPAVAAMIHNDAIAFQAALREIGNGNPVGLAKVIFVWYETAFIDKPCALLGNNDVKDTLCGGLSDAIMFIADTGEDLAKKILGTGKDILEWLGVWGTVDDLATGAWNWVKGVVGDFLDIIGLGDDDPDEDWRRPADCRSPEEYFANTYLTCLPKAVGQSMGAGANMSPVNAKCNAEISRCTPPSQRGSVSGVCASMDNALGTMATQTAQSVNAAADYYTSAGTIMASVAEEVYANENFSDADDMCSPNFWAANENAFAQKCAKLVSARFPLPGWQNSSCPMATARNPASQACIASLRASSKKNEIAGPNSEYCKKQTERERLEQLLNPCTVEITEIPVVVGGVLTTIKQPIKHCRNDDAIRPMNPGDERIDNTFKRFPFDISVLGPGRDTGLKLPRFDTSIFRPAGGLGSVKFPPTNVSVSLPPILRLPNRLPSGPKLTMNGNGIEIIDIKSTWRPNLQIPNLTLPPVKRIPATPTVSTPPVLKKGPVITRLPPPKANGPGQGGIGLVNGASGNAPVKGNRAMDVLGGINTNRGLDGAATNAGGPQLGRFPAQRPTSPAAASLPDKKGGGTGGIGTVKGSSGNAPINSKGGSTASAPKANPPPPRAAPAPTPDDRIDYGGCSLCNKKDVPSPVR